jgi:O-antigen biosynthesis protein
MPDLSIIIVSWNVKDKLRENLKALFESKTDFAFDVYVVDNNSEDGTDEMVKNEFPEVYLVENNVNFGFGKANNQVLRQIETKYALLLNPDMEVRQDTLQKQVDWMDKNPQAAVASCKLIDEKGETIKHVRRFPKFLDQAAIVLKIPHLFPNVLKKYIREDFDYKVAQKVDSVRGGFFMINLEKIKDLKMYLTRTLPEFDDRYFLWFEEVDFCRQIYKSGGEVWYAPDAECVDFIGQSFSQLPRGQAQKYFQDSQLKYFKRWQPSWQYYILRVLWPVGRMMAVVGEKAGVKRKGKS